MSLLNDQVEIIEFYGIFKLLNKGFFWNGKNEEKSVAYPIIHNQSQNNFLEEV